MERWNSHKLARNGEYLVATIHPSFIHPLKVDEGVHVAAYSLKEASKILKIHPPEKGKIIVLFMHHPERKMVPL